MKGTLLEVNFLIHFQCYGPVLQSLSYPLPAIKRIYLSFESSLFKVFLRTTSQSTPSKLTLLGVKQTNSSLSRATCQKQFIPYPLSLPPRLPPENKLPKRFLPFSNPIQCNEDTDKRTCGIEFGYASLYILNEINLNLSHWALFLVQQRVCGGKVNTLQ